MGNREQRKYAFCGQRTRTVTQAEWEALREALVGALVAMTTTRIIQGVSPFMMSAIEQVRAALILVQRKG